jgi:hypothetical protein
MSAISVQNNMEKQGKSSDDFTFKKRTVRNHASRKRKGSSEEERTYYD